MHGHVAVYRRLATQRKPSPQKCNGRLCQKFELPRETTRLVTPRGFEATEAPRHVASIHQPHPARKPAHGWLPTRVC